VPSNTYTTRDGENIVIAGNGDAIFKRLMLAMGRIDLAGNPELERNDGRVKHTQRSMTPSRPGATRRPSTARWKC
jgi:formyl-CoA transferase